MKRELKTNDDSRDLALLITDKLISEWLVKCEKDTEYNFEVQDVIHFEINKQFNILQD